jgi:hypothetical protein
MFGPTTAEERKFRIFSHALNDGVLLKANDRPFLRARMMLRADPYLACMRDGFGMNLLIRCGKDDLRGMAGPAITAAARLGIAREDYVNLVDNSGFTALARAAQNGLEWMARFLLENGADSSIVDVIGSTPESKALGNNHTKVAELIQLARLGEYKPEHGTITRLLLRVKKVEPERFYTD